MICSIHILSATPIVRNFHQIPRRSIVPVDRPRCKGCGEPREAGHHTRPFQRDLLEFANSGVWQTGCDALTAPRRPATTGAIKPGIDRGSPVQAPVVNCRRMSSVKGKLPRERKSLVVQSDFCKIIEVVRRKLCSVAASTGKSYFRRILNTNTMLLKMVRSPNCKR